MNVAWFPPDHRDTIGRHFCFCMMHPLTLLRDRAGFDSIFISESKKKKRFFMLY